MSAKQRQPAIIAILVAFFLLSLAYSVVNPLHEATDELRHYRFVQHIVQRGALPVQGEGGCSAQGHHPPLYYAAAALATAWIDTGRDVCYEPPLNPFWAHNYWEIGVDNKNQYLHKADEAFPWSGEALAAHLSRLVNILIGTGVVFVTYLIGRTIWPRRDYLALGGAAIVAFNPMFLYMSAAVNNDVIAALAGAAVTLAAVRLLRDEQGLHWQWGIILGLLYGLALLSKFNLAAIIVTIELAVTWVAWRKRQWREWLLVNGLIALAAALIAGWWFGRNQLLYGEPTGFQRLTELWGVRDPADSWQLAFYELPYVWTSLWGRFGYGQIPLPQIVYIVLGIFAAVSLAGIAVPFVRRDWDELHAYGAYLALLVANVGLFFAVIFNYLLVSPAGPMGRFFFPALPSLALLIIYGASCWLTLRPGGVPRVAGAALSTVIAAGLFGLSLAALLGYLAPAYAQPLGYELSETAEVGDASFGGLVTLRGSEIAQSGVSPGGDLDVTLYWEVTAEPPGDYLQFIHLIDEQGLMVAQRDTHPGLGRFPSSQWQPGDTFQERIRLHIPETAYTPELGTLSVGYYAPQDGYRLGVYAPDGSLLGDSLELGTVSIASADAESGLPNPLQANFANQLRLVGYEYDRRQVQPGDNLLISLYWQKLAQEIVDYEVQLRLLDEDGAVVQTIEQWPTTEPSGTSAWPVGQVMFDQHPFRIAEDVAPGVYDIQLAVLGVDDNQRLQIVHEDGRWIDDKIHLADLRVEP